MSAESIREVIAKLKQQQAQQNFQASQPPKEEPKAEAPEEEEEFVEEEEPVAVQPEPEKRSVGRPPSVKPAVAVPEPVKAQEMTQEEQIAMGIEMLQNNGRYRAEILHQIQEMNKALVVIAGVLVDLLGAKK